MFGNRPFQDTSNQGNGWKWLFREGIIGLFGFSTKTSSSQRSKGLVRVAWGSFHHYNHSRISLVRLSFLPLLCATAQQSYSHGEGVHRPSIRSSVKRTFSQKPSSGLLTPDLMGIKSTYPQYLKTVFKCVFFTIVKFCFSLTWKHMRVKFRSQRHRWKYTTDSILLGSAPTKAVQLKFVKFQILDLWLFLLLYIFLSWFH